MIMDFAKEIKQKLTTDQVFRQYGFKTNGAGFVCCPFHSEKTASLKVYDGEKGWHCFGCGENGDLISFVMKYFRLSFRDAIKKINEDFCLCLPIGKRLSDRERQEMARQTFERRRHKEEQEKEESAAKAKYWAVCDEYIRLDKQMIKYKPKKGEMDLHPLFVEAIINIEKAKYDLSMAEMELKAFYEARNNRNS